MYSLLLFVHRWFGITVGLFFVLLGLSGSYIMYKDTFQSWVEPQVRRSSGAQGDIDLARSARAAQQGLNLSIQPTTIKWYLEPERNLEFVFSGIPGEGKKRITAFVDPVTSEFKGQEVFRETFSGKIFYFHHDIFLDGTGRTIMGFAGFAMMFILLGGLYLWWPRKKTWLKVLSLGNTKTPLQTNIELHKFFGFYTLALMTMVTFSGLYISKPGWFQKMPPPAQEDSSPLPVIDFLTVGEFLKSQPKPLIAQIDLKKSSLQLQINGGAKVAYDLLNDLNKTPLEKQKPKDTRAILRALHGGQFWNQLGGILIFISGLLPLFFYISGLYIWWKKSQMRQGRVIK